MVSKAAPSAPSMDETGKRNAVAWSGEERLPRSPMPSKNLASLKPAALLSTSHKVLTPAAAIGAVDQT